MFLIIHQRNAYIDATLLETIGKANQCIVDTQANATKLNQFITQNPESTIQNYARNAV